MSNQFGAVLLLGVWLLAGCDGIGPGGPTPPSAPILHPTGAHDIVIQLQSSGGGMVPSGVYTVADRFPGFTLYGDGTLLYRTGEGYYRATLQEADVQQLLSLAVNDVQFFTLDPFLGPTCCDMPESSLQINAEGRSATVGFSILDEPTPGTNDATARLSRLLAALDRLRRADGPPYDPPGVTLYADGGQPPASGSTSPIWPVAGVTLADALRTGQNAGTVTGLHLTGDTARAVLKAAPTVQQFTQDGRSYLVVAVPDLP